MSQLVVITRGLPYSGKSSFARQWVAEKPGERSRISRDDIRLATFGSYVIEPALEKVVTQIEHASLRSLLQAGRSVVIDNQNLREEPVQDYLAIAADYNVPVLFRDFSIELKEALRRHAAREVNKLPEELVKQMYARFFRTGGFPPQPQLAEVEQYVPDESLPGAWVFDMDGTLALFGSHRGPFDWAKLLDDEPNPHVVRLAQMVVAAGDKLIIVSGRSNVDQVEADTRLWLEYVSLPIEAFFLRAEDDTRPDALVKQDIFDQHIRHSYNVRGVVDDRLSVSRMWHRLGLPLFRVGSPDAIY